MSKAHPGDRPARPGGMVLALVLLAVTVLGGVALSAGTEALWIVIVTANFPIASAVLQSGIERLLPPAGPRKTIPRADLEADIAAVNPGADACAQLARDDALVLDGLVGNAAPRVHHPRPGEGAGRARVETTRTLAAEESRRLVSRRRKWFLAQ